MNTSTGDDTSPGEMSSTVSHKQMETAKTFVLTQDEADGYVVKSDDGMSEMTSDDSYGVMQKKHGFSNDAILELNSTVESLKRFLGEVYESTDDVNLNKPLAQNYNVSQMEWQGYEFKNYEPFVCELRTQKEELSMAIFKCNEHHAKLLLPLNKRSYDLTNMVLMGFLLTPTPELIVMAGLQRDQTKWEHGTIEFNSQVVGENGEPVSLKGVNKMNKLIIVAKLRDITDDVLLKMKNPDGTYRSDSINALVDLMEIDRWSAVSKSAAIYEKITPMISAWTSQSICE